MVIAGIDPSARQAEGLRRWGRAYWDAVHEFNRRRRLRQLPDVDEGEDRVKASYGDNYGRLAAIKNDLRSGKPVPGEPEHSAGGITAIAGRLGPGRNPKLATGWGGACRHGAALHQPLLRGLSDHA